MITEADIRRWRGEVPWTDADNVEQDLVLSRLVIEIANHPLLGNELVFRGGTCFHKIWLDQPWRHRSARVNPRDAPQIRTNRDSSVSNHQPTGNPHRAQW